MMETARATVKATAKVFDMFATQIYADKYTAIVRELVANAIDAHTAAGKNETPVKVWLPDEFDPYFRVTDTGIGMSHEFMMTKFMAYTDGSTKDQSNDQIGGWGIGSKSPFSYTDQFVLVSVHDGVRSVYSVFKDEDSIPAIALLSQEETTDANGVEVSFPVETHHFNLFREATEKVVPFFTPLPNVVNHPVEAVKYDQLGAGWGIINKTRDFHVVMGGVRYPIEMAKLPYELRTNERLNPFFQCGLDLYVPIGSVSITPSRETLLYSDLTNQTITDKLEEIIDEVVASIPTMFENEPSLWAATVAMHEEIGGEYHIGRGKLVTQHARWRGQEIKQYLKPTATLGVEAWKFELSRRAHKVPPAHWEYGLGVTPHRIDYVIYDDLEPSSKNANIARIRLWGENNLRRGQEVLVLRGKDALEAYGNPQDVILTSDLPKPERTKYAKAQRANVRAFGWSPSSRWDAKFRHHLEEIPCPEEGVLVVLDNFSPREPGLETRIRSELVSSDRLVFVNKVDAKHLKHFTPFDKAYKAAFDAALSRYPTLPQAKALLQDEHLRPLFQYIDRLPGEPRPNTPLGKIFALHQQFIKPAVGAPAVLQDAVKPKLPPRINGERLAEAFKTKQWKAKALLDTNYLSDPLKQLLKEFI
ncbi:ATP-binding protein [Sphingopyxis indica]|nr:ATP-binding protein [Sphingopyxis indica]